MDKMVVATRIKAALDRSGISQNSFAHLIGADHSTISLIINGRRLPSLEMIKKIACELKVSIDWLLGEERLGTFECPETWSIARNFEKLDATHKNIVSKIVYNLVVDQSAVK